MVIAYIFSVLFFIGLSLNIIEMAFLIRGKKITEPFNMVVFGLATADLLSLAVALIISITWQASSIFLADLTYAIILSVIASQLHIIIITLQRFIAVVFPFRSKAVLTSRNCFICLVAAWILSFLLTAVLFMLKSELGYIIANYALLLCGAVLFLSYSIIVHRMVKSRRSVTSARVASSQNIKVVIYSFSVTLVFMLCNYPLAIKTLILGIPSKTTPDDSVASFLYWLNPMIDPITYFLFHACKNCRSKRSRRNLTEYATEGRCSNTPRNKEEAIDFGVINASSIDEPDCSHISSKI